MRVMVRDALWCQRVEQSMQIRLTTIHVNAAYPIVHVLCMLRAKTEVICAIGLARDESRIIKLMFTLTVIMEELKRFSTNRKLKFIYDSIVCFTIHPFVMYQVLYSVQ